MTMKHLNQLLHLRFQTISECNGIEYPIIEWAKEVAKTTAEMIAHWMRMGLFTAS